MGWFSKNRSDNDGLYTGDAPVSMPGADGAAPTAYSARPTAGTSPAPAWNVGSEPVAPASSPAPEPTYYQPPSPPVPPPSAIPGSAPWNPGVLPPPPTQSGPPPWTPGQSAAFAAFEVNGGQEMTKLVDQAVRLSKSRTVRTVASPRARVGCLAFVVLVVVLAIGLPIFLTIKNSIDSMPSFSSDPPATALAGTVGAPLTLGYRGAELSVTVKAVYAQPVDAWSARSDTATPHLVAEVGLSRVDTASGSVSVMSWDWHFQPTEGPDVDAELISDYEPNLSSPALTGGKAATGYLTFDSGGRSGVIYLKDPNRGGGRVAEWKVTGAVPAVVVGTPGKPVRPLVGMPAFTVTLSAAKWLAPTDPLIYDRPAKTPILMPTFSVKGMVTDHGYGGQFSSDNIWFVPRTGPAVPASASLIRNGADIISISGSEPQKVSMAIPVAKGPGTIEVRDDSGRPVARWAISGK